MEENFKQEEYTQWFNWFVMEAKRFYQEDPEGTIVKEIIGKAVHAYNNLIKDKSKISLIELNELEKKLEMEVTQ